MSQYVRIYYGPYDAFYTTSHKPQRLRGVRGEGFRRHHLPPHTVWHGEESTETDVDEAELPSVFADKLRRLGYRVDLVPVDHIDYCVFEMIGHEVFRCNIRNLQFNTETEYDSVSRRAVDACVAASAKFQRARTHFWLWTLLENTFMRSEHAPRDHWPFEVEFPRYASCGDCVNCCGILTKKIGDAQPYDYNKSKQALLYTLSKEKQPQ